MSLKNKLKLLNYILHTTQQQHNTIRNPQMAPAVPTTQVRRMNRMTPKMFWMHGKKTPIKVPVRVNR